MRVGPSLDFPADWVYRRKGLPVKVVQVVGNWRKIEDESGTQGWMHVAMLTGKLTAMVIGGVADMRESPSDSASILFRAQPGVVGNISDCANDWCAFDVGGKQGFIRKTSLWGGVN